LTLSPFGDTAIPRSFCYKEASMNVPEWIKPAAWGVAGGAVAAMIIGFTWGGWMTSGTANEMAANLAETAVVAAYTPVCVANAKLAGADQMALLKAESSWSRDDFVLKAGWVGNIDEAYREAVAEACAPKVMEALQAPATSS
jgi:hypothetical protein